MGIMLASYFLGIFTLLSVVGIEAERDRRNDKNDLAALWTTWGRWTPCSRSCDSGIQSRRRYCVARGKDRLIRMERDRCPDSDREIQICKGEPCPPDQPSPREVQCTEKNNHLFGEKRYEWYPYTTSVNPCLLGCMAKKYGFFYNFGPVIDGTRCHNETEDICVEGYCRNVGCDGKIGSNEAVDNCGVCGGRNRKCFHFKSVYSDTLPENGNYGYTLIAKIPAGATYLTVKDDSQNYLALADSNMSYIINGNFKVVGSGKFNVSGTLVHYSLVNDKTETITADGPTTDELSLMLIFLNRNPGVSFEYWIPREKYINIHSLLKENQRGKEGRLRSDPTYSYPALQRPHSKQPGHHQPQTDTKQSHSQSKGKSRQIDQNGFVEEGRRRNYHKDSNKVHNRHGGSAPLESDTATPTSVTQQSARSIFAKDRISSESLQNTGTNHHHNHHQSQSHHSHQKQHGKHHRQHKTVNDPNSKNHKFHKDKRAFLHYRRRRPNTAAFLSDQASCPSCDKVELSKENSCGSDFVLKVKVLWFDVIGELTRYEVKVLQTYSTKIPIMHREYIWATNKCRCPYLRLRKDYILSGHLVADKGSRESRLIVSPKDFSSSFAKDTENEFNELKKKC